MTNSIPLSTIAGLLLLFFFSACSTPPSDLELPALFNDHMVLQQSTEVAIWGKANPGSSLQVSGTWGAETSGTAGTDGNWAVRLNTPEAGGPYELSIEAGDTTIRIGDVMVGEVWLASGQSNMEMPLEGWPPNDPIVNSAEEISKADYDGIRMFTVARAISSKPETDCVGSWQVCSPSTAGDFSAAAYFFARKLHQTLNVPIGIIHSSWGGTPAEAWTEIGHLSALADYRQFPDELAKAQPQQGALATWLNEKPQREINSDQPAEDRYKGLEFGDQKLGEASYKHEEWPVMELPGLWERTDMPDFDGVVWFRRTAAIPKNWIGKPLVLELGPIDDMDMTLVNGRIVGENEAPGVWNVARVYPISEDLVLSEKLSIATRVLDTGGGGGFSGQAEQMKVYLRGKPEEAVSLAGEWHYLPVAELQGGRFYIYGTSMEDYRSRPSLDLSFNAHTPTVLYNAMIAPLVPYTLKGAIWYQGESNVSRAEQYELLFPAMIKSWRAAWGLGDFPFYFVQIAPYRYGGPQEIASAQLRDAQRKSLALVNTGMAVALDIGNVNNIHPGNKQDVGARLALWALAKDYDQDLVYSGPLLKAGKIEGDQILLSFDHTGSGLVAAAGPLDGFEIAGPDGNFVAAEAVIQGNEVVVSGPSVPQPRFVRYAFHNGSGASLFNKEGLPASSFTLELQEN